MPSPADAFKLKNKNKNEKVMALVDHNVRPQFKPTTHNCMPLRRKTSGKTTTSVILYRHYNW
jgi:hypothetical protein